VNTTLKQFENQLYLNLETFRKNGENIKTPVWFVQEGEKIYIRTVSNSGKVKRIRNNGQVNIVPCGQTGEALGVWLAARASEVSDGPISARAAKLINAKYGNLAKMFEAQTLEKGLKYTIIEINVEP
jgi:PPOX class probable F420-dependent enzyme